MAKPGRCTGAGSLEVFVRGGARTRGWLASLGAGTAWVLRHMSAIRVGDVEHLAAGVGKTWLGCVLSSVAFAHRLRAGGECRRERRACRIQYAPTYVYLSSAALNGHALCPRNTFGGHTDMRKDTTATRTRPEEVDITPTGRKLLDRKSVRLIYGHVRF